MDETTTAPTTSARAASGGGRVEKKGGQKKCAQNIDTERRSRCSCRSATGVNTDRSERA